MNLNEQLAFEAEFLAEFPEYAQRDQSFDGILCDVRGFEELLRGTYRYAIDELPAYDVPRAVDALCEDEFTIYGFQLLHDDIQHVRQTAGMPTDIALQMPGRTDELPESIAIVLSNLGIAEDPNGINYVPELPNYLDNGTIVLPETMPPDDQPDIVVGPRFVDLWNRIGAAPFNAPVPFHLDPVHLPTVPQVFVPTPGRKGSRLRFSHSIQNRYVRWLNLVRRHINVVRYRPRGRERRISRLWLPSIEQNVDWFTTRGFAGISRLEAMRSAIASFVRHEYFLVQYPDRAGDRNVITRWRRNRLQFLSQWIHLSLRPRPPAPTPEAT